MSLHLISSRGDYREVPGLEMGTGGPLHFIKGQLCECLAGAPWWAPACSETLNLQAGQFNAALKSPHHFCLWDYCRIFQAKRLWAFWCGAVPSLSLGHYNAINADKDWGAWGTGHKVKKSILIRF